MVPGDKCSLEVQRKKVVRTCHFCPEVSIDVCLSGASGNRLGFGHSNTGLDIQCIISPKLSSCQLGFVADLIDAIAPFIFLPFSLSLSLCFSLSLSESKHTAAYYRHTRRFGVRLHSKACCGQLSLSRIFSATTPFLSSVRTLCN